MAAVVQDHCSQPADQTEQISSAGPAASAAAAPANTLPASTTEAPQFKFPPFTLPEGVNVVSFADFEPGGILLPAAAAGDPTAEDDDDVKLAEDVEVDVAGVPTVQLPTSHEPLEVPTEAATSTTSAVNGDMAQAAVKAAHKRRRNKAKKLEMQAAGSAILNGERRMTWWEKWEQEEQKKRSQGPVKYDLGEDRYERLDLAVRTFKKGHALEAGVQSIWDRWLDFIGLLRNENQIPGTSKKNSKVPRGIKRKPEEGEFSDEDDDDVDEPRLTPEEQWDERMIAFLEDPMLTLKRFFSSHYHDEGMYWSDAKLRDGPIIVSFFLRYLIQDRVFPEYEKKMKDAYTYLEDHIQHDLTATRAFSMAAEDDFSVACCNDLGTMVLQDDSGHWADAKTVLEQRAKRDQELLEMVEREKKAREEERKRMKEEMEKAAADGNLQPTAWGSGRDWSDNGGGWGEPVGWGDSNWGWNDSDPTYTNDAAAADPTWVNYRKPTLVPLSTPLTHTLLRTERSVRRIVSVHPPNPNSTDVLRQRYATIVFEPWPLPDVIKENDILRPAEMLAEATGEKELEIMQMPGGGHTLKDRIELLVDPEHADRARNGLGVYAIWVQAGKTKDLSYELNTRTPDDTEEPTITPALSEPVKAVKSYASVLSPRKTADRAASVALEEETKEPRAETFWFFQHVSLVVPSYWTE